MKRKLQALAVLILAGIAKLPLEQHGTTALREMKLRYPPLEFGVAENLGQAGFAAALGGLRSLVASVTYMQAYAAFENVQWGKVDTYFQWTTRLQPREAMYWEEAAWHMAYNAASYYQSEPGRPAALREQLFKSHVNRGITILTDGLEVLPESSRLWGRMGDVMWQRKGDRRKAAEAYLLAAKYSDVSGRAEMLKRQAAYQMAESTAPDLWQRGYAILKRAYDNGWRVPGVIVGLKELEQRLHIPAAQHIPDPMPQSRARQPAPPKKPAP